MGEELKLFIQMLNEKHIPILENVSRTEKELPQSTLLPLQKSEENDGSIQESTVIKDSSTYTFNTQNNKTIEENVTKIAEFEPKSLESNRKVEGEKRDKEEEKQDKLQ